jgi:hypothetical protein
MKKGFADIVLFGGLIMLCLVINNLGKPYNAQDRADIQKSFGQKQGNVITGIKTYSDMTVAEKAEMDSHSAQSPSFW